MPAFAWFLFYNLFLVLGLPLLAGWLLYRKGFQGKGEGWMERFGFSPSTPIDLPPPLWIHAVSAGEVAAATPFLRSLLARFPDTPVVISTLTPAGRQMAERACSDARAIFYYPYDLLPSVSWSLRRVRPQAVLLMEAELWPNFLTLCRRRGIPVLIVNGRISDRGYRRARRIRPVMEWMNRLVTAFGMQTAEDAQRARALGADPSRIKILGQTKFDQETQPLTAEEAQLLRRELGLPDDAIVLVGGSTRPGEEAALLQALKTLRPRFPKLRLILAPRHLERADEVEALAKSQGWRVSRRTKPCPDADLLLLDTMGELGRIYAVAEIGFVGGTLANIGGHNLLQPVAQGKPVLFGPHTQNVRDIADLLIGAGVGFRVRDTAGLIEKIEEALTHPEAWADLKARALHVLEANKGASDRYVDLLNSVLAEDR